MDWIGCSELEMSTRHIGCDSESEVQSCRQRITSFDQSSFHKESNPNQARLSLVLRTLTAVSRQKYDHAIKFKKFSLSPLHSRSAPQELVALPHHCRRRICKWERVVDHGPKPPPSQSTEVHLETCNGSSIDLDHK